MEKLLQNADVNDQENIIQSELYNIPIKHMQGREHMDLMPSLISFVSAVCKLSHHFLLMERRETPMHTHTQTDFF